MIKRNDIIIGVVALLVALAFYLFFSLTKSDGSKVEITVQGEVYETLELSQDQSFLITLENGEYNTVVIEDGYVRMSEADCPDKLCVKHNKIHYNHETIVCLPHKVVVEIVNGEANTVDLIAK